MSSLETPTITQCLGGTFLCSANFFSVRCLSRFDRKIRFANEAARCSAIAQLVEQATVNRPVVGSSPTRGATLFPTVTKFACGSAV